MRNVLLFFCLIFSFQVQALSLRESAPERYIVRPGDSLWQISAQYLHKPWEWKQLWRANPQIRNPDFLYPGDEIILSYAYQKPYLRVTMNGTVKLSPHMRPVLKYDAIPPIPLAAIKPFLNESIIMDDDRLHHAPYVVAFDGERMRGGQGDLIFINQFCPLPAKDKAVNDYAIFREAGEYKCAETGELLGYKARLVGQGKVLDVSPEHVAKFQINTITTGVQIGDRILPHRAALYNLYFLPKTPDQEVCGKIIDILGDFDRASVGYVVAIDQGKNKGLEPGDVLAIYSKPRVVEDPEHHGDTVHIPPQRIGELMVFRAFNKASFALVMHATKSIRKEYGIKNP